MTAPERIWIIPDTSGVSGEWQCGWYQGRENERHNVEYTRTDTIQPMIALALVEAAKVADDYRNGKGLGVGKPCIPDQIASALRALAADPEFIARIMGDAK